MQKKRGRCQRFGAAEDGGIVIKKMKGEKKEELVCFRIIYRARKMGIEKDEKSNNNKKEEEEKKKRKKGDDYCISDALVIPRTVPQPFSTRK